MGPPYRAGEHPLAAVLPVRAAAGARLRMDLLPFRLVECANRRACCGRLAADPVLAAALQPARRYAAASAAGRRADRLPGARPGLVLAGGAARPGRRR